MTKLPLDKELKMKLTKRKTPRQARDVPGNRRSILLSYRRKTLANSKQ